MTKRLGSTLTLLMCFLFVVVLFQACAVRATSTSLSATSVHLPLIVLPPVPKTAIETFDGDPTSPQAWNPTDWDITIHSPNRDTWYAMNEMPAAHGSDCAPPPATHTVSAYADAVFICKNHMMTAIKTSGYGAIYLTPAQMVDFSEQEVVIRFDMSTERTSPRDWIGVWISPYEEHVQLPGPHIEPRDGINIFMPAEPVLRAEIIRDFTKDSVDGIWWVDYREFLTPSPKRRDTFEIRISPTHLKVGMPDYDFWWIDADIPALDWSQGVVQFGHYSYNPEKGCDGCGPNTWHWDNISITPAAPFTMLRADRRFVDATTPAAVTFPAPAPANAHLRFAGLGTNLEVSFDGGVTWQPAQVRSHESTADEHFKSHWTPIPAGVSSVQFRGEEWWGGGWHVRDISIWSPDPPRSG